MKFKTNYHYLVILIFFTLSSFFLSNYIGLDRHWASNLDHEFTLVYNALLFNSELPIEYFDHPGFFTILFLSLFFQIFAAIDLISVYNLSQLNSENFDQSFQDLIFLTRIFSTLCLSLFCFVSYVFLHKFSNHKIYSFILSLIIFSSEGTIFHLAQLRTELLAMFFVILSLIFLRAFLEDGKKSKLKYLSGFFLFIICALLNKMQVFFLLPLFLLILHFYENSMDDFNVAEYNFLNKKWVPYTLFFIVIFYIWKDNKNILDSLPMLSTLAILVNLFFMNLFFLLILKKRPQTLKVNLVAINLWFILIFFLIENFLSIHPSTSEMIFINLTRIMGLSMYISHLPEITETISFTHSLFTRFFTNFVSIINTVIFKINIYSVLIILNLLITTICRKHLTSKMIKFNFTCLVASILIVVINSYRSDGQLLPHYLIFSELVIVLSFCNFVKFLKVRYLVLILFLVGYVNFQNNFEYIKNQKINDLERQKNIIVHICKSNYLSYWHKSLNEDYYKSYCNNYLN